mmetsp:Transcript_16271/g.41144  ORF Transcript_16271/g.41144 Transcript_16271/m.41144 type:complete len:219 (-) Transcript_16271:723-1379(-)
MPEVRFLHEVNELCDDPLLHQAGPDLRVERQVEHQAEHAHDDVVARGGGDVLEELRGHAALDHLVLVLEEDAKLLEEGHGEEDQLGALAVQHLHQHGGDLALLHLALYPNVLGKVHQHPEADKEELVLLLLGDPHLLGLGLELMRVKLRLLLLELLLPVRVALELELDDAHDHVAYLVLCHGRVEGAEVGEGEEDVDNVDDKVHALARLLAENAREGP